MFNFFNNISAVAMNGRLATLKALSTVGLVASGIVGCDDDVPPQELKTGVAARIPTVTVEPVCAWPARSPQQENLPFTVNLEPNYLKVQYADQSRFIDINPSESDQGLDYFVAGQCQQILLMPSAAPNAKRFANRAPGKLRNLPADQREAALAKAYFKRGQETAEQLYADLQVLLSGSEEMAISLQRRGQLQITFKDRNGRGCQAWVHFYTSYDRERRPQSHLNQLRIQCGEVSVHIKGAERLQPVQKSLESIHQEMAASNERHYRKLEAERPQSTSQRLWRGIHTRD